MKNDESERILEINKNLRILPTTSRNRYIYNFLHSLFLFPTPRNQ